ncbi:cadmium-translocating P-type ATPase [Nordella sp. HKS 07]|uniref:heavy metal translocating P-type ATPase n=1 Tax=Nordella sp. HKS 07 TaxID=2712222 RepID=UPI0013E1988D|nr:heavy metal translocating P-type ATPase [Nordella sp. HKS 07]QIG47770.1 cadmium-translocating P-type ATPase [Nordella sp. HKS 07]
MSCCGQAAVAGAELLAPPSTDEVALASRDLGEGLRQSDLSVPGIHCAHCIGAIEGAFKHVDGVEAARVNLSSKRVAVKWRGEKAPPIIETLRELGYDAHLFAPEERSDPQLARLIRAMAVAGFCSMNIMLLSVSIWSGAEPGTRQAFHWISAGLALPALLYSGRIFFFSAWSALRKGRTNMDVPISIGVVLAFGLSLYDTVIGGPHAYFDAATSLLFFLLIGRTLDHLMREKARSAVQGLAQLTPRGATVIRADGGRDYLPAQAIEPGMLLQVTPGERILVDGVVEGGQSDIDCSLATGETRPHKVAAGDKLRSGMLNLTGAFTLRAQTSVANSFLAEMTQLMEAAESSRGHYRRLADRAAGYYAPVVHALALLTLIGWLIATGDWHRSISVAIAVLIITCPCALGLAVPIVQAVAARRLFESGIMVKDGAALERLAEIDQVAFDKTGTLTLGHPRLIDEDAVDRRALAIAAALAQQSNHPLCRALALHGDGSRRTVTDFVEIPGSGLEARIEGHFYRLGRGAWAGGDDGEATVLTEDGKPIASVTFEDDLRPRASEAVRELRAMGIAPLILSGDARPIVRRVADGLGIEEAMGAMLPKEKTEYVAGLGKALMVGDGLNDAPALARAHVSMAPASAADIGRNAADFVFLHRALTAVPLAIRIARDARRLVGQNFALAILYNVLALPFAMAGYVTPLLAALAMSASSIVVVANALRLRGGPS